MKCLIPAAGFGSRLQAISASKPLTPVAGIPLIEHVMSRAAAGGATSFVVVTGHEAGALEAALPGIAGRLGLPVVPARTPDWSLPNGHSVLTGAAKINGDYLLMMADHLVDPAIVARVLAAPRRALTLAVDTLLSGPLLDIDDTTKVATGPDGAILRIAKTLTDYDAVDTGVFLATPALAVAIREAIAGGKAGSISEGVQRLADQGQAWTADVTGLRWLDVDEPRFHAMAETLAADPALKG
ncbi:MAG: NTP transferase domain-containing protein [Pseudomonadota bacterium]